MGYRCPVCELPHVDGEHLANHLAFTAMLRSDQHETWLEEHIPSWENSGPEELIPVVTEHAEETEFETVFDDTTAGHDHDTRFDEVSAEEPGHSRAPLDDEAKRILENARELTARMYDREDDEE